MGLVTASEIQNLRSLAVLESRPPRPFDACETHLFHKSKAPMNSWHGMPLTKYRLLRMDRAVLERESESPQPLLPPSQTANPPQQASDVAQAPVLAPSPKVTLRAWSSLDADDRCGFLAHHQAGCLFPSSTRRAPASCSRFCRKSRIPGQAVMLSTCIDLHPVLQQVRQPNKLRHGRRHLPCPHFRLIIHRLVLCLRHRLHLLPSDPVHQMACLPVSSPSMRQLTALNRPKQKSRTPPAVQPEAELLLLQAPHP
jgi:hypothetical protein